MYRNLKHTVLSTTMIVSLFAQQLFGAYHMFTTHVDDCFSGIGDGLEMVASMEVQCDLCAKLDSKPVTLNFHIEPVFYTFHFLSTHESIDSTFLSTRLDAIYRRGPPKNC
ncbi:hypothetical protein [Flagellimonas flava]|uniref:Secreted protein n=1 Tax=Flagellimonas flava TaxID=570519 RepID=A0A1M5IYC3_9FLAO|nr:hypothetical protein [Allomuricauda flava]SHG33337.1 hypothetical protein SAMN04488116_1005 [Allomuricauda flava]